MSGSVRECQGDAPRRQPCVSRATLPIAPESVCQRAQVHNALRPLPSPPDGSSAARSTWRDDRVCRRAQRGEKPRELFVVGVARRGERARRRLLSSIEINHRSEPILEQHAAHAARCSARLRSPTCARATDAWLLPTCTRRTSTP
jgi:hypothetical protein